jgi:hypothetical protein
MSWKRSRFASSLMSLWGEAAPVPSAETRIKSIRQAMLDSLTDLRESAQLTRVQARVLYATDVQALWYLRGDLMNILADVNGESAARAHLVRITGMFNGLLPSAQKSRPSRFHR